MSSKTLSGYIERYLRESAALGDLASQTVDSYRFRLQTFVDFCEPLETTKTPALTKDIAIDYFSWLGEQDLAPSTIYAKKQALRSFWNWAHNEDLVETNLDVRLKHPPEPQTAYLEPDEITRMEKAANAGTKRSSILHLRDQAVFSMIDGIEIPFSALVDLRVGDYDAERQMLQLGALTVWLNSTLCQQLDEYLAARETQARKSLRKSEVMFASFTGRKWSYKYIRRAVERHRRHVDLSPLQSGESTHPADWPLEERKSFIQTPVLPYDRSIINSKLILGLGLHCGLRAGEMLAVKISHIDSYQSRLYVNGEEAKGKKSRFIPLNEYMMDLLESHLRSRAHDEHLLVRQDGSPLSYKSVRRTVKTLAQHAGISYKNVTPHTLRHSFATHLKNLGVSIDIIKNLLGHSSISETERYLHTGENEMALAVEKLAGN